VPLHPQIPWWTATAAASTSAPLAGTQRPWTIARQSGRRRFVVVLCLWIWHLVWEIHPDAPVYIEGVWSQGNDLSSPYMSWVYNQQHGPHRICPNFKRFQTPDGKKIWVGHMAMSVDTWTMVYTAVDANMDMSWFGQSALPIALWSQQIADEENTSNNSSSPERWIQTMTQWGVARNRVLESIVYLDNRGITPETWVLTSDCKISQTFKFEWGKWFSRD
jgi:hypothetical protein